MSLKRKRVRRGERVSKELANNVFKEMHLDPKKINPKEFYKGMNIELEHFDVTNGDLRKTAKITLAHLRELPDYNTRLERMERDGRKAKRREKKIEKSFNTFLFDDSDDD